LAMLLGCPLAGTYWEMDGFWNCLQSGIDRYFPDPLKATSPKVPHLGIIKVIH
jgi:hypothetical protein